MVIATRAYMVIDFEIRVLHVDGEHGGVGTVVTEGDETAVDEGGVRGAGAGC